MKIAMYFLSLVSLVAFSGCDEYLFSVSNKKSSSTSTTENVTRYYNGPGSKWELILHDYAGFTLREEESFHVSVSGEYAENTSGFIKLRVDTSTNPTLSLTQGYLLEIPNVLTLSQPLVNDGNYSQLIAMIPSGVCHTSNINNNWIDIKRDINSSRSAVFGTFTSAYENATASLPHQFDIIAADLGEGNISAINCNQGLANLVDGRAYMHSSGNSIIHTGLNTQEDSDDRFLVSIPSQNISAISALADEYIGFVFDSVLNDISPLRMTLLSDGNGTGYKYTDLDNAVLNTAEPIDIIVHQVNKPLSGFVNLGIKGAQSRCIFHANLSGSGKKVLLCTGDNPAASGVGNVYTMLLVSK